MAAWYRDRIPNPLQPPLPLLRDRLLFGAGGFALICTALTWHVWHQSKYPESVVIGDRRLHYRKWYIRVRSHDWSELWVPPLDRKDPGTADSFLCGARTRETLHGRIRRMMMRDVGMIRVVVYRRREDVHGAFHQPIHLPFCDPRHPSRAGLHEIIFDRWNHSYEAQAEPNGTESKAASKVAP